MSTTIILVEIAVLIAIAVVVEWLATVLTHSTNLWALMIGWGVYLIVRVVWAARSRGTNDAVSGKIR